MTVEALIERQPLRSSSTFGAALDEWKRLQAEGFDVTCLLAPDERSVVWLACRVSA